MKFSILLCLFTLGWFGNDVLAQDTKTNFQILLPDAPNWNKILEGNPVTFRFKATGASSETVFFSINQGQQEGMYVDSTGLFEWTPSFDLATRTNNQRTVQVIFEARTTTGQTATRLVEFLVQHVNRPPRVEDLKPFYVQFRNKNTYKIEANSLRDDDGDPVVVIPVTESLPEGARLTSAGEFTWQPSQTQFNALKINPLYVDFLIEDQPAKARAKGRLKVEATQMDLPPSIAQIPNNDHFKLKENAVVDLKFYLSDPNGDDDIVEFGFLSDNQKLPSNLLIKNTPNQYEFIWTPGYDFVKDPLDSLVTNLTFYVIDKARNRDERRVSFTVQNAVNEAEVDKQFYDLYRGILVEAWNLITQLSEKEQELKKAYLKAKKGKKNRSMLNASLGAVTGISPAVIKTTDVRSVVSAVGGTTILTIGTLEATEVIGKPLKDLLDRYNYVLEKKTEVQGRGDVFAREYALKAPRRQKTEFLRKRDEFRTALNLKGPVTLDLDAGWENKKSATDKALVGTFKDFTPLEK
jgi:hypothetical protein